MKTIHDLSTVINTVKKSNNIKSTFCYLTTTTALLTYKVLRFFNY